MEKMDWNLLKEIESNVISLGDPGSFENPSFDAAQPLSLCNLNQWDTTTSNSFEQFASDDFIPTLLEDPAFDGSKLIDISYNFIPTPSGDPANEGSMTMDTLEKDLSRSVNGSGSEGLDSQCHDFRVPDCGLLNLDQVDDIFMNSLSDEDIRTMVNAIEPFQQVGNQCNMPFSFQDILANTLNDPINNEFYQNGTMIANGLNDGSILLRSGDPSVNSSMMSQGTSMASEALMLKNPRGRIRENGLLSSDVAKPKILEATELHDLEAVLSRINQGTRICFRDAFYRLANDSKGLRDEDKREFPEFYYEPTSSRTYRLEPLEKETNVIDRAVLNLLFNPA